MLPPPGGSDALNTPIGDTLPVSNELEIIDFDDTANAGGSGNGSRSNGADSGGKLEVQGFPVDARACRYRMTTPTSGGTVSGTGNKDDINLLPAGSFIPVAMLNGVDAPTGGQAQSGPAVRRPAGAQTGESSERQTARPGGVPDRIERMG
ncbi:IncF plasmid conjugative transfer pilus assembly protein TraB [Candidatus Burkholderia pumila]|uniref:IncF plasmid conjugative transfer pilus assembly protein TraB n=1 Tax=Candidatus Burkholderia pumila TaxID=1090375 RepID=A0ABR5HPL0_9BURK|nr:IncF plasmid conjugative transfer pilus assembly protein TraB [Candidatus Burkholderia pumila]